MRKRPLRCHDRTCSIWSCTRRLLSAHPGINLTNQEWLRVFSFPNWDRLWNRPHLSHHVHDWSDSSPPALLLCVFLHDLQMYEESQQAQEIEWLFQVMPCGPILVLPKNPSGLLPRDRYCRLHWNLNEASCGSFWDCLLLHFGLADCHPIMVLLQSIFYL